MGEGGVGTGSYWVTSYQRRFLEHQLSDRADEQLVIERKDEPLRVGEYVGRKYILERNKEQGEVVGYEENLFSLRGPRRLSVLEMRDLLALVVSGKKATPSDFPTPMSRLGGDYNGVVDHLFRTALRELQTSGSLRFHKIVTPGEDRIYGVDPQGRERVRMTILPEQRPCPYSVEIEDDLDSVPTRIKVTGHAISGVRQEADLCVLGAKLFAAGKIVPEE